MNIEIDTLRLQLPPPWLPRVHTITHEFRLALAGLPAGRAQALERLVLPPLRLDPAASDRQIGSALAQHLGRMLAAGRQP